MRQRKFSRVCVKCAVILYIIHVHIVQNKKRVRVRKKEIKETKKNRHADDGLIFLHVRQYIQNVHV